MSAALQPAERDAIRDAIRLAITEGVKQQVITQGEILSLLASLPEHGASSTRESAREVCEVEGLL